MAFTFGRESKISRWLRDRPRVFFDWEKTEGVLPPELYDKYKHEEGTPMLLEQATPKNVSRAIKEINAFEWEGDFKPMARQALKQLVEKRLEEVMAEYLGLSRYEHAVNRAALPPLLGQAGPNLTNVVGFPPALDAKVPSNRRGCIVARRPGDVATWVTARSAQVEPLDRGPVIGTFG